MVGTVPLISSAYDHSTTASGCYLIQVSRQCGMTFMVSHIGSDSHTDNKRSAYGYSKAFQIFEGYHDITLRISRNLLIHQIKFPQVRLCLSELHHYNICLGRCPQESQSAPQSASRRHTGKRCPMTDLILTGHDLPWVFTLKRRVDLLSPVFCPVKDSGGWLSGLYRLIPDSENPGAAILIPEDLLLIPDSCIQEPDHNTSSGKRKGTALYLRNTATDKRSGIKAFPKLHQSV